jgi:hypothetical protein
MADKKLLTAESLPLHPLALARYYHHGLKAGFWTSVPTALATMKDTRILVSRDILRRALRVYRLPNSVLGLFEDVHLTNTAAKALLFIVKRDGLPMIVRRSEALNARDFTSNESLLEALGKKSNEAAILPGTEVVAFPLLLAKEYIAGLESGRWETQLEASVMLKVPRHHVIRSLQISRLPIELLELFKTDDLTFRTGRRLLSLKETVGLDVLTSRASTVSADRKPLAPMAAFAVLLQKEPVESTAVQLASPHKDSALIIAKIYDIGKRDGRWSTMGSANKILGLRTHTVGRAVRVSKLPQFVLALFGGDRISHKEGYRLLSIFKEVGPQAFFKNAMSASKILPRPSREKLFRLLAGAAVSREDKQLKVSYHVSTSGHEAHIRVSGPNVELLRDYLDDIRGWCGFLLKSNAPKK